MLQEPGSTGRLVAVLLWAVVLIVAVWLRFWQLGMQITIDDEWHAIHQLLRASWRDIFLSFGTADYSIPLTLLFNGLFETIGLSDRRMRLLPMVFGLATVVIVPWLFRPWLDARERWLLALLLAISPVLILFSRNIRPYAMVVLLGLIAVIALWQWWQDGRRRWLAAFMPATVLSAWLHPLTSLFAGAALLWFSAAGLLHWRRTGRARRLLLVLTVGGVTVLACAALILPPIFAAPGAITDKAGVHSYGLETLMRAWELVAGTARAPVAWIAFGLAVLGGWRLWQRDHLFLLYWLWLIVFVLIVLQLLRPAWIHNALVLVRYGSIAQPFMLALVALGTVSLVSILFAGRRWSMAWAVFPAGLLLAGALYLSGPFPWLYSGINQFTNAMRYQADYDLDRSIFSFMNDVEVPEFVGLIGSEPGDWQVVDAPWYFESNNHVAMEYQGVHQRPVRIGMISGLCAEWTWGEIPPAERHRLVLRPFIYLTDILSGDASVNRFVVFHLERPFEHSRELPAVDECVSAFRQRFGAPWFESDEHVVFRLPAFGE